MYYIIRVECATEYCVFFIVHSDNIQRSYCKKQQERELYDSSPTYPYIYTFFFFFSFPFPVFYRSVSSYSSLYGMTIIKLLVTLKYILYIMKNMLVSEYVLLIHTINELRNSFQTSRY